MPEMSADVEDPSTTVAMARKGPTPSSPRASEPTPADSAAPEGDGQHPGHPTASTPPNSQTTPGTDLEPRWRLATVGYLLVLAGFALALVIPRIPFGRHDQALVIVSITSLFAGMATVLAAFVLNLLR